MLKRSSGVYISYNISSKVYVILWQLKLHFQCFVVANIDIIVQQTMAALPLAPFVHPYSTNTLMR